MSSICSQYVKTLQIIVIFLKFFTKRVYILHKNLSYFLLHTKKENLFCDWRYMSCMLLCENYLLTTELTVKHYDSNTKKSIPILISYQT